MYIWPDIDIYAMRLFFMENYVFLVYMYYTHPSYQTSIVGKNCAYYIRIFTVHILMTDLHERHCQTSEAENREDDDDECCRDDDLSRLTRFQVQM